MGVELETHEVSQWTATQIVFYNAAPTCVMYAYTIDLATKSVHGISKKKPKEERRGDCDDLAEEVLMTLDNGFKISQRMSEEAMPWFGDLAAYPFRLLMR